MTATIPSGAPPHAGSPIARLIDDLPLQRSQIMIVAVVLAAMMIDGVAIHLLSDVAPIIIAEWKLSRAEFGPAMAGSLIGMIFGTAAGGWLGDRYGQKRILTWAIVLFGLATLAASLSGNLTTLFLMRMAGGLGFGAAAPNAIALVVDWVPARIRTKAMALLSISAPLGGAVGAAAATVIIPEYGWRGCFVAAGVVSLLMAVVVIAVLPESLTFLNRFGEHGRLNALLQRFLNSNIDQRELAESKPVARAVKTRAAAIPREYRRLAVGTCIANFSVHVASLGIVAWATVYLSGKGFSLNQALHTVVAGNLLAVGGALASAYVVELLGSRKLLIGGMMLALGCIAFAAVELAALNGPPGSMIVLLVQAELAAAMFLIGMCMTTLWTIMAHAYPPEHRGTGIGASLTLGRVGILVILLSGGALVGADPQSLLPFFGVIAVALAGTLIGALIIDRHVPARRQAS